MRVCPPQNATLDDIFTNKDKIDNALRSLEGVCIFSVEMMNPYKHHQQLLLAGGAGAHYEVAPEKEGEKPVVQMIPESSNYDESIIPETKDDVEVVINNAQIEDQKVGVLDNEKKQWCVCLARKKWRVCWREDRRIEWRKGCVEWRKAS